MKNIFRSSSSPSRPKTGQSSVRGKTISNPIPIPSALDDEFPIRNPGTGVATPMGISAETERQLAPPPMGASALPGTPVHPEGPPPEIPIASSTFSHAHGQRSISASPPRPTTSPTRPGNSPPRPQGGGSPPRHQDSPPRRPNASSTLRYSMVSNGSTAQTGQSRETPQRKKSTLRTALGKLFGRKKKNASAGASGGNLTPVRSSSQHRSDPTALNRAPERAYEPKRSASLPITEFDRALRSHSVGPEDITAIESARNSYQAEPSGRRRAATTSSRLFVSQRNEWGGLSPRPASTHGRGSKLLSGMDLDGGDNADPNEIGRAITSDLGQHRRRSRSLSGLHDIENERGDIGRRSDEIRYWRQSYDPGFMSPLSSNGPENDGAENTGTNQDVDTSTVIMPDTPAAQQLGVGQPIAAPRTPPQPFTFPSMNEMAGMRITQAANIESRINNLESRMHTLERVVSELCHTVPNFSLPIPAPVAPQGASVPRSMAGAAALGIAPEDQQPSASFTTETTATQMPAFYTTAGAEDTGSHMSFGDGITFTESLHPVVSNPPPIPFTYQGRPMSSSTVRGAASLPTLHQSNREGRPDEEYAHLMSLIAAEKSARMALEAKVRSLSQRVDVLSGGIVATPHRAIAVTTEPPHTAKSLGTFSAFDDDPSDEDEEGSDDDDEELEQEDNTLGPRSLTRETTAVAGRQVEIHVEDDASYSEAFETPREEVTPMNQGYGYGAFGEELKDEDTDGRKKAARTLSLSQLTLGKGVNVDVPSIPPTPTLPPGTSF